jgi:hypothetical protein
MKRASKGREVASSDKTARVQRLARTLVDAAFRFPDRPRKHWRQEALEVLHKNGWTNVDDAWLRNNAPELRAAFKALVNRLNRSG